MTAAPDTGAVISVNEYMNSTKVSDDENNAIKAWHNRCAELVNAIGKSEVYSECKLVNSVFGEIRRDVFGAYFTDPTPEPES